MCELWILEIIIDFLNLFIEGLDDFKLIPTKREKWGTNATDVKTTKSQHFFCGGIERFCMKCEVYERK